MPFRPRALMAVLAPAAQPVLARERTLTIAAPWEVTALDPAANGYVLQRLGIAETLVDAIEAAELVPGLATGWTTSRWPASDGGSGFCVGGP